jgi:hypothetical protein
VELKQTEEEIKNSSPTPTRLEPRVQDNPKISPSTPLKL